MNSELLFDRFEVRAELGNGAFGRVLLAFDIFTEAEVAVKTLRRFDADALLRLKQEFRSLADLAHPNLVQLGELFESRGQWGFSMELVRGSDFFTWVRPAGELDVARLRAGMLQVTRALAFLHNAGLVHCDVKPSNLQVTPEGRVVLLDLGLVTTLGSPRTHGDGALGTPAYMAPEQGVLSALTPAADFYALGVVLYEALSGVLPFVGSSLDVLVAKQRKSPALLRDVAPSAPGELVELCEALLRRDPSERPDATEVLRALGDEGSASMASGATQRASAERFIGRGDELARLDACWRAARERGFSMLLVEGESGVGKTALVRHFTRDVQSREPATLVLRGRCHAAEQVPFKAFDGVVDGLARFLCELDEDACAAVLPRAPGSLAWLFPVLARVPAVARARARIESRGERVERHAMFAAFAELLERIAMAHGLIVAVDDLQWSDEESLRLLYALADDTRQLPALWLATVRPLDREQGPLAERLCELARLPRAQVLELSGLSREDAVALSAELLARRPDDAAARRMAELAGGHPLFIAELSALTSRGGHVPETELDDAIRARAAGLPLVARHLVEMLALSAAPTATQVLRDALEVSAEELARAVRELRAAQLVRSEPRGELVCHHDRVREALASGIAVRERALVHRRLARVLEARGSSEPARVARHWLEAEEPSRAAPWLERAAREAFDKAAFERAAQHYRELLGLEDVRADAAWAHRTRLALSDSLACAGLCAESARVLLEALPFASEAERTELRERAAQQLLQAGAVHEGVEIARAALEGEGLSWAGSSVSTVARLLWHRTVLSARGLVARETGAAADPAVTRTLDTIWRLSQPLGWVDLLRTAELGARHLRLALDSGNARHIGLALCAEAVFTSIQSPHQERLELVLAQAKRWVERDGSPELEAYFAMAHGQIRLFRGDARGARSYFEQAELIYRTRCPGLPWLLANVRGFILQSCIAPGDFVELCRHAEAWVPEARERGDKFAIATLVVLGFYFVRHLMADDPDAARAEVHAAMAPWRSTGFGVQHLGELLALQSICSYEGGDHAHRFWLEVWPRIRSSFLLKTRFVGETVLALRAAAAVNAACDPSSDRRAQYLDEAKALVKQLARSPGEFSRAQVAHCVAQIHVLEGNLGAARTAAREARAIGAQLGCSSEATSDLLLEWLDPDGDGPGKKARMLAGLARQGWRNPERTLRWLAPALAEVERRA